MGRLIGRWLLPILFPFLLQGAEEHSTVGRCAERLFAEGLHADALALYSQWLPSIEHERLRAEVMLRMAACHLAERRPIRALVLCQALNCGLDGVKAPEFNRSEMGPYYNIDRFPIFELRELSYGPTRNVKFDRALTLLNSLSGGSERGWSCYLMSRAYRQLGASEAALSLLACCASQPLTPRLGQLIQLEQGLQLIQMGELSRAEEVLKKIEPPSLERDEDGLPYCLAQLQLAKIYLGLGAFDAASQALLKLSSFLKPSHPLLLEAEYLQGWLCLASSRHDEALLKFEGLLSNRRFKREDASEALRGLAAGSLQCAFRLPVTQGACNALCPNKLKNGGLSSTQAPEFGCLETAPHRDMNPSSGVGVRGLPLGLKTDSPVCWGFFQRLEALLLSLHGRDADEASRLLLSELYLMKSRRFHDPDAYCLAQKLLSDADRNSPSWLAKCAAAAPSYAERCRLYEALCVEDRLPEACGSQIWFLRGVNHLEEGIEMQKGAMGRDAGGEVLEMAAAAFLEAFQRARDGDDRQAAQALKYAALSCAHCLEKGFQAWQLISKLLETPQLLSAVGEAPDLYGLAAWISLRVADPRVLRCAKKWLQDSKEHLKLSGASLARHLKFEGLICLQLADWESADAVFAEFIRACPRLSHGEAWFWRAYAADRQHDSLSKGQYLRSAYTLDPGSPYAPLAYFQVYSYREYMHGERRAIKHLQNMPQKFPNHPLLVNAYYLIGLYAKKDHLSNEGAVWRKKDWIAAIEAFQLSESTFDLLFEKDLIPSDQLARLARVRCRARYERALANLAVAEASVGGKRRIYLEYAERVFKSLIGEFSDSPPSAAAGLLLSSAPYPSVWAEANLQLAKIYVIKGRLEEAEGVLDGSLSRYGEAGIKQGYGLMQTWYEKGQLALAAKRQEQALDAFVEAEKAVSEALRLSPHEKFELWIQQSLCYRRMGRRDEAMRLLSRVLNDEADSPLRVRAMWLRGELYEEQGRRELALKQWEAAAAHGGEWGEKSKEKLEQIYGE